jgi:hypothetical protein
VLLRPGKTPSGKEIRGHVRRLIGEIRRHWPHTRITLRGDSHYGRGGVMDWCEDNGIDFFFRLFGNDVLCALVEPATDNVSRPARRRRCRVRPRLRRDALRGEVLRQ